MARDDIENRGGVKRNSYNSNNTSSGYTSSSTYLIEDSETQWTSWLVPMFVVANIAVFIVVMYINDCPKHRHTRLKKLGALDWSKVVQNHQGWRLITCVWLHAGVIHLLANMLSLIFIGIRLEQQFGFVRIGILYLLSGFGGSVLSSLFIRNSISVGASGALFGLLGAMLSELITNWNIYTNKAAALLTLLIIIVINLAIGILPHVDNFAHIGGFLTGFLLGFILLPRPQFGWLERRNIPTGTQLKSKYKPYQYILWLVSLVLLIVGFTVALVMLFRGAAVDCITVTGLVSTCSAFITYGTPDPFPGSPCCEAVANLGLIADSTDNRRSLCICLMGLITTYTTHSTAIATLPGICGVTLGFIIDPNTDCNL
ncbi:Plant lipid transfer protein/Par allergen [Corchorus olitorius]|uniref:RHOMBOID-like protein n=1 Tax=Corchorus olitorius TaxID=93759 RepID=A0A1R3JSP4_9ROSI|nr:Plant lipid transfer protein/Par allergen [Corchorus olitorius]